MIRIESGLILDFLDNKHFITVIITKKSIIYNTNLYYIVIYIMAISNLYIDFISVLCWRNYRSIILYLYDMSPIYPIYKYDS